MTNFRVTALSRATHFTTGLCGNPGKKERRGGDSWPRSRLVLSVKTVQSVGAKSDLTPKSSTVE